MALPVPNLDDRDYTTLLADAKALVPTLAPDWTDLSDSDPGVVLLELMAYLTDSLIYRVNRLPEKAYVAFLDMVGVTLRAPVAASVELELSLAAASDQPVTVPRGTRVATGRADGPVFQTVADTTIAAGQRTATVTARHSELRLAEPLGTGTGHGGQRYRTRVRPIVMDSSGAEELVVAVAAGSEDLGERVPTVRLGDVTYRIWREVPHFGVDLGDGYVYRVDHAEGVLTFGDGAHGRPPGAGRDIVAWYQIGGGAAGNVAARTLTVLKDPVAGVSVANPRPASGGRDAETLAEAMVRGSNQVNTYDRVVTARDYEHVAVATPGVGRAVAAAEAELWAGAAPGRVRVLAVPAVEPEHALSLTPDEVLQRQSPLVLERLDRALAAKQPLGVSCAVGWAGLKRFHVEATIVATRADDAAAVSARLDERLRRALTPFPVDDRPGWPFGEAVRASTVYDTLLDDRGVRFVEEVALVVEEVPGDVTALVADPHQGATWFCASDERVFRSTDDTVGWELLVRLPGERVERLSTCPGRPGLVLAATRIGDAEASRVHVSHDYGESWQQVAEFAFHVEDAAVGLTQGQPALFLATDNGLFRLELTAGAVPEVLLVDAADPAKGCYAVHVVSEPGDDLQVAVAAQKLGGVFVSFQAGRSGTYQSVGLAGADIRLLRTHRTPGRRFLLAGSYATGDAEGDGVALLELLAYQPAPGGWRSVGTGWSGGSCRGVASVGDTVYAATSRAGVLTADASGAGAWLRSSVDSGLPLRDVGRFQPVDALAATDKALAGCVGGVYLTSTGRSWRHVSQTRFADRVALPRTWLFAPGAPVITVRSDDARG